VAGNRASKGIGRRGKSHAKQLEREIGRKWVEDIVAAAKERSDKALNTLEAALDSPRCPWSSKVQAAQALLDRGWGKPKEFIESEHKVTIEDLVLAGMRHQEEEDRKLIDVTPPKTPAN
jgi:hypothetical protein